MGGISTGFIIMQLFKGVTSTDCIVLNERKNWKSCKSETFVVWF
jgi:hypothetical protein